MWCTTGSGDCRQQGLFAIRRENRAQAIFYNGVNGIDSAGMHLYSTVGHVFRQAIILKAEYETGLDQDAHAPSRAIQLSIGPLT